MLERQPLDLPVPPLTIVDDAVVQPRVQPPVQADPADLVLTCANCGARMDERRCKLICRCGYFASCSDYY
jgi:hypothetical protein